ncbi:MAG: putative Ig domain-containing protein [Gammaproteobacteria bacterium]
MSSIPAFAQPFIVALLSLGSAAHRHDADGTPALTISGNATSRAAPATFYAFTPTVYQSGDRPLEFKVRNKPRWATFGKNHGTLFGKPGVHDVGAYSDIVITVSDGKSTVELPAFTINVSSAPILARK